MQALGKLKPYFDKLHGTMQALAERTRGVEAEQSLYLRVVALTVNLR